MAEQLCPACGCVVGAEPYEKEGVLYCCEPCSEGSLCECGCCSVQPSSAKEEK